MGNFKEQFSNFHMALKGSQKEYVASNQSTTLAVNLASGLLKKKTKVGGSLALTLRQ